MEDKEATQEHNFVSKELARVEEPVKKSIEKAISMVWDRHVGEPASFKVIYVTRITDLKTGKPTSRSAKYDPDTDTFIFARDTIPEKIKIGLPPAQTYFIVAAHEATHKVQLNRGDELKPSPRNVTPESHDYFDDKHEAEAWREALDAFKKAFPTVSGGLTLVIEGRRYEMPEKSSY